MSDSVHLTFRYTQRDYVRALRRDYASRLNLPLDLAVVILLAIIGVFLWRYSDMRWLAIANVVVSAGFALLLVSAFTIIPPLAFRREPKFRDEYSLTFSPEGIHFRTSHIDSRLDWGIYSRAVIDAHSYILYYGTRQFSLVPKRVFECHEERLAFEELLMRHVAKIIRHDVSDGSS